MTRLLVIIAISFAASEASPVAVRLPWVVEACPSGATWDAIASCLAKPTDATIMADTKTAKLVHVVQHKAIGGNDLGVYLYVYVERAHKWQLGGMYESSSEYVASELSPLTVDKIAGWRIDLEVRQDTTVQIDAGTQAPAIVDRKLAILCAGTGYYCTALTTSCDVLIHGKAYWSYRGKLVIERSTARVEGDRRNAGDICEASSTETALNWNQ